MSTFYKYEAKNLNVFSFDAVETATARSKRRKIPLGRGHLVRPRNDAQLSEKNHCQWHEDSTMGNTKTRNIAAVRCQEKATRRFRG